LSTHIHLGLPSGLFSSGFPANILYTFLFSILCYIPCPAHPPWLDHSNYIWWKAKLWSPSWYSFLQSPITSSLFSPNILCSTLFSNTLSLCSSLNVRDSSFTPIEKHSQNYSFVYSNFCKPII
jgi:hypothetical protein